MMYLADGERYVVFASNAGADDNPAWYWNLKSQPPTARIEVGDDIVNPACHRAAGRRTGRQVRECRPSGIRDCAQYQRMTSRTIPVVALTTTGGSQESPGSQHIDFDALYRGESPGEGMAADDHTTMG